MAALFPFRFWVPIEIILLASLAARRGPVSEFLPVGCEKYVGLAHNLPTQPTTFILFLHPLVG